MADDQERRARPIGETSGSDRRPAQRLRAPVLTFDLAAEGERLRAEASWQRGDRNAKTLVKEQDLRVVLTVLRRSARLQEHQTAAQVSIQTLSGRLRLHLPDQAVELPAGHLLVLEPAVAHDVEALDESAFLLTLSRPGSA
jgi:quercetin dioxygenase-like cupin family protein